ncbi:MAG: GTP-binding protein [Promethearchaeota archaeon]
MSKKGYIFKVVVVGDGAVGKTSLVMHFTEQKFSQQYIMTIGSNFALKLIPSEMLSTAEKEYPDTRLQLWDLAGQVHFKAVRFPFYKGSAGIIYVFDVTRKKTLDSLHGWRGEIMKTVPEDTPSVILANKVDLVDDREVSREQGEKIKEQFNSVGYFETSAKEGTNVTEGFKIIAKSILDKLDIDDN